MMIYLIGFLALILSGYTVYLLGLTLAAATVKEKRINTESPITRIAILIPAHNEEQVIARTLQSLKKCNYPTHLYDCWVIADNCTDCTAEVAIAEGAKVVERNNEKQKGKGYALEFGFSRLLNHSKEYEGVIVLDADTVTEPNTLLVADEYLRNGHRVIQLSDMVEPAEGSWSNESIRIGFILYNYVRPLGRKKLGLSAGLRGNGMIFNREIINKYNWNTYSLAEDLEFGLELLLKGEIVVFAPEATVWARMTSNPDYAESQRRRWEIGRYPVVAKYAPALLRAGIIRRKWKFADAFIDLTMPPLVNLMLMLAMVFGISFMLGVFSHSAAAWAPLIISGAGISAGIAHLLVGLSVYPESRASFSYLFIGLPKYIIWKSVLYLKILMTGSEKKWVRTTREK